MPRRRPKAVRRVEEERVRPGAVADALVRFEWAFRQPGRHLNASEVWQPGLEAEDARDDLEKVVLHLPLGARIDEEFERRTLPNPRPVRVRALDGWWWARTRER
ncbi:hypothetical protein ACFUGD_21415 [Streptomyces sp. NPDC057217]|uniref:hypothetical protein n=1 Tax=Streptomyces sp. NPDC057217 TaxID=3346054 RepID=UPI00363119F9